MPTATKKTTDRIESDNLNLTGINTPLTKRNETILQKFQDGESINALVKEYGLSRTRIHYILDHLMVQKAS